MLQILKAIFKLAVVLIAAALVFAVCFLVYLTITEYRPAPIESLEVAGPAQETLNRRSLTVLSWNVGYCALGEQSDFFMDGGSEVRPDSKAVIDTNLDGVKSLVTETGADFTLLQEVDSDSKRSYSVDERAALAEAGSRSSAYALNFCTKYVPYPWPPIGRVNSGLLTLSDFGITEAERISLACPFSWPVSMVNLKRCLLVTRIPLEGSERELVLVNLHLEAYDDGEGKAKQSEQLRGFLEDEYEKGNYVVAGGDWNQIFPGCEQSYPNTHTELWTPGYLDESELAEGWRYVWDESCPSCRLLNQPYDPADAEGTQYYVIDGFLVSPNVEVGGIRTLDEGFRYSDHNPVLLELSLKDDE